MKFRPSIFFDRDGTLIEDVHYLSSVNDIRFFQDTVSTLRIIQDLGFQIFIVTNQSGIAKGYISKSHVYSIHDYILKYLRSFDVDVDAIVFCPHEDVDGCMCRKPGIGMLKQLQRSYAIDLHRSIFIGDKYSDLEFGVHAKIDTILMMTGYGKETLLHIRNKRNKIYPTHVAYSLKSATDIIFKFYNFLVK